LRDEVGQVSGVTVAVVTMGRPEEASAFCQRERLPFRCLSDPARAAYRAYGLRRGGLTEIMGPGPMLGMMRAATRGHFVGVPVGDVYQLGGVFLIGTDGRLRYLHYARHAGDHPAPGEIARAARAVEPPPPAPLGRL
jgi:AhpC/TSA antioxidant enzyme